MVFDIFVEPHCPQRVMRQFGLRQVFPGNVQPTVPPADHSLTRRGQLAGALWAPRVQQYVDDWVLATEEVINELFPHTEENYRDYLRWYLPRTRARVTFTPDAPEPHVAAVTDAYPTHRDRDYFVAADAARDISADITAVQVRLSRGLHLTDVEQRSTFDRMQEKMRAVMRVFSCRSAVDVVPPAGPVHPRPRGPTVGAGPRLSSSAPSFGAVRPTAPVSHGPRMPSSAFAGTTGASASSAGAFATSSGAFASSSSHGASIPHPHGTLLFINTVKYLYETDGPCPAGFAAGIFGTGASSSHAGRTGPTSQFYDDDLHGADHQDVLGSSQLGGAPEAHTQEQPEVTPVQAGRVGRAVPPDRLTYSQGHIRAQGRRDRGKRPRQ
ncbi:uncharacterized protein [Oryza sativa Japonica Group]|uniref:uncharacterized protein n=1 Tax=Oryza sativa subsp. japonica TaxID=39947 RepID=UPI00339C7901